MSGLGLRGLCSRFRGLGLGCNSGGSGVRG